MHSLVIFPFFDTGMCSLPELSLGIWLNAESVSLGFYTRSFILNILL
jgi:hypothetical protein